MYAELAMVDVEVVGSTGVRVRATDAATGTESLSQVFPLHEVDRAERQARGLLEARAEWDAALTGAAHIPLV
jgi:hypothetical protein